MSGDLESVLVVGAGNELLGDEGLGVHVARRLLAARSLLPAHVAVLECGTCLFDVVPEMSRHSHVIIVDAIRGGREAGTVYRAEIPGDLNGQFPATPLLSLHQWGVMETLQAAKLLGLAPPRITVFGAEPEHVHPSLEPSPALARAEAEIFATLLSELGAERARATSESPKRRP
jgi:hydrogenase maturation protease